MIYIDLEPHSTRGDGMSKTEAIHYGTVEQARKAAATIKVFTSSEWHKSPGGKRIYIRYRVASATVRQTKDSGGNDIDTCIVDLKLGKRL